MLLRGLTLALALCLGAGAATLKPGKVAAQPLSGGRTRSYSLPIRAGDYIYVEARQFDLHLHLALHAPDGKVVSEIRSLPGTALESVGLHHIAGPAGKYRIDVTADDPTFQSGRYELRIVAQRPPTDVDKKRVDGEKSYAMAANATGLHEHMKNAPHMFEAQKIFGDMKEFRRWTDMFVFAGEYLLEHKYYEYAGKQFSFALQAFEHMKDSRNQDLVLTRLGVVYTKLSQFDKAVSSFDLAIKGRRDAHDRRLEAEALDGRGAAMLEEDRYEKALADYGGALQAYREIGGHPLEEARELENLGRVFLDLNQYQAAVRNLEEALALVRRYPDPYQESYVLLYLAQGYNGLGDAFPIFTPECEREYKKAVAILEQARNLRPREEDFTVFYAATALLGTMQMKMGLYQPAIENLEPAIKMAHMGKDPRIEGVALNVLAAVYRTQPRYDLAIANYAEARTIFHEIGSPHLEALALAGLMRCWSAREQPRVAIFYGKQAVNLLQSVRSNNRTLAREMQESFLRANEEPYHDLAELLIAQNRLAEAEQVINLLKEQEYHDYVRGDSTATVDRSATLTPEEGSWTARDEAVLKLGVERDKLSRAVPRTPQQETDYQDTIRREREAKREYVNFLASLKEEAAAGRVDAAKEQQLEESEGLMKVLRRLAATGERAAVIYTLVAEKKLLAILITPEKLTPYEYPIAAADLNKLILDFRQVAQNPEFDPRPLGRKLYQIVLGKLAADLEQSGAKTVMWSLDGCLRYLPLAALYDGEKYLIERYRLSVFTPASLANLQDKPDAKWAALGLGVSKKQGDAQALPEVASELKGIIAQGPGAGVLQGEIMLDEQFTEKSMRTELRKGYPVVHIASHFQFQPGDDVNSFLLLGDGSHFSISDLKLETNLFDKVQLLTLSACNTGMSQPGADGKEVENFGVLAQRQGADAVIASLWPVADTSTSRMMQRFYQVRESNPGMSKLAALQQAQLALLHGDLGGGDPASQRALIHEAPKLPHGLTPQDAPKFQPDPKAPYAHPYHWAAFYLMGNWL